MQKLYTPEGEALRGQPWPEYPRPLLERDSFYNLNGEWEFAAQGAAEMPAAFPMRIQVPFAPESILSGVERHFARQWLFYRKTFALPQGFVRRRTFLHFGAVDQIAEVFLNGVRLGGHTGGYAPFSFEATDALQEENTLVVRVRDELENHILPYGKQREKRGGMWYTPVSGIWQTVWLESMGEKFIRELNVETGSDFASIDTGDETLFGTVSVETPQGTLRVPLENGRARVALEAPRFWSPDAPYLYRFTVETAEDRVRSYFALRTLETRVVDGVPRLCLNGKPYFFNGLLDQGYWSDGLFTPASPACFAHDILMAKRLGFNMLRKHIKVEPQRFYYECDRLGMIVFQDMVNNGGYSFLRDTALPTLGLKRLPDRWMHPDGKTRAVFLEGMDDAVRRLKRHPCVCCWTIFNEGWGQFDSGAAYRRLRRLDATRFIDSASGWFAGGESDVESRHVYFKPFKFRKGKKPVVLSEFGGYALKLPAHSFNPEKTYGYRSFKTQAEFMDALEKLYREEILPAIEQGLCAAVYTQLSDVEDEVNGLTTYDRRALKCDEERMRRIGEEAAKRL